MPVKVAPEKDAKSAGTVATKETNAVATTDKKEYLTGRDNLFIIMEDQYHNVCVWNGWSREWQTAGCASIAMPPGTVIELTIFRSFSVFHR